MSARAVTQRLKAVNQLRRACLRLADSSAGRLIREKFVANESVQRLSRAIGTPAAVTILPSGQRDEPKE